MKLSPSTFIAMAMALGAANADLPFINDASAYNAGAFGPAPNQTFRSSPIVAPRFQVTKLDRSKIDKMPFLFFEWTFNNVSSPMIFRSDDLSLVYADPQYLAVTNVRVQKIQDKPYLTFWEGTPERRHGNGHCLFFDEGYNLVYDITSIGLTSGRLTDEHECQVSDDGTVLITVYEYIEWDFTDLGGPPDGTLIDQVFQEIDPETNELLFSWRASVHFPITDSFEQYPDDVEPLGFDPFHMNSLQKVGQNYLVGSRGLNSAVLISGKDGSTIWVLGGKNNNFTDLSSGKALDFAEQHMPRFITPTRLTMFDNHMSANTVGCTSDCSRGLELDIDTKKLTAKFVREYPHPMGLQSIGRGGMYKLKNGNALVAWGTEPAVTEHKGDEVVMDIQVGRLVNGYFPGGNAPYRAFKMDWFGKPTWAPSIVVDMPDVFVSWNGATEVDTWVIVGADRAKDLDDPKAKSKRKVLAKEKRNGFETKICPEGKNLPRYLRAMAVDKKGKVLDCTAVVDSKTGELGKKGATRNCHI